MNVQCPNCGTVYDLAAEYFGRHVECQCGKKFEAVPMRTVPDPPEWAPAAPVPPAPPDPPAPQEPPRPALTQPDTLLSQESPARQVQFHINNSDARNLQYRVPYRYRYTAPIARRLLETFGLLCAVLAMIYFFFIINSYLSWVLKSRGSSTEAVPVIAAIVSIPCGVVFGALGYGMAAIIRLLVQISEQLDERK